jgi:hypothetical protein
MKVPVSPRIRRSRFRDSIGGDVGVALESADLRPRFPARGVRSGYCCATTRTRTLAIMASALARLGAVVVLGSGAASAWLGCNAIAGIQLGTLEEMAPSDSGTQDGGRDATTTMPGDGGGPSSPDAMVGDAGSEASTFTTYSCTTPSTAPFVVANLQNADGGTRAFDTNITLGTTSNQQPRIVVDLAGNQGGNQGNQPTEAFRAYDVQWQPKQLNDTVPFMAPQGSHLAGAVSTTNGITAIVTQGSFDNDAGSTTTVNAYSLPAGQQNVVSSPPPYPLTTPVSGFNQGATTLEMGVDDQFVVTNSGPLQSNRASRDSGATTPTTFAAMGPSQGGSSATLVQGNSNVYVVYGGNPGSDASTLVYKVPNDGVNTQVVTPSTLPANMLLAAAQRSTTDPTKIVTFAATLVTLPSPVFTLFAGLVDADNFDKVQLGALATGPSLMIHDVPANKGTSAFVGDSLVLLGLSPVASDNGLNFVWVDSSAHVLATAVGDSRLYNSRPGIQAAAITPGNNGIAGVLATFFVAWIEEQNDAAGAYDVLYLDQIQCAAN